jgi:ssDNA-binding Zn-finger/Zn-ribbon topoisomerase 1
VFHVLKQRRLFKQLVSIEVARGQAALEEARAVIGEEEETLREALRLETAFVSCPRCGSQLQVRKAKVGRNKGLFFWGCRRWPACSYTADIECHEPHIVRHSVEVV